MEPEPHATDALRRALAFLDRLEAAHIWYRLGHIRDSLLVEVAVPGERWEIEFFPDGQIEVERYLSSGTIEGAEALDSLFARFIEP